ncbi:MAG: MAPEG family protein [Gammaproteobacteria bacterium]|jgi:glutathione S-transferase|nr:MAPEG family protein [Gammaproteobacteria bacterium]MBT5154898.1 MAPEG family protein [Gammaproteobacteria bacterium]MBT5685101.1 MAPEG family protein [Gammaproteobacteria bacterium]MBT5724909.1 MAPEG family protein [Gammaproteobacteria bacterium]MBT6582824.1 MAPEG family protein [Gammaproteobacteria bacterium]
MEYVALVVAAALAQCFWFAFSVAGVRQQVGIEPPAMSGDETLERALAVHRNTVEFMTIFVSLMLISGYYFDGPITAVVGLFWIISRQWYRIGYMRNVKDRIPGFLMGDMVLAVLVVGELWGIGREILARFVA